MKQLTVAGYRTSVMNNVSLTSDNLSHTALSTGTPVSVVMPVRNEERHLAEAVRHVLAQDYPAGFEVVLAVGPSSDATARIARELAAADPRVTVVDNPSGRIPAGNNAAIKAPGSRSWPAWTGRAPSARVPEAGRADPGGDRCGRRRGHHGRRGRDAVRAGRGLGHDLGGRGRPRRVPHRGADGAADTVYLGVYRRVALEQVGGYDEAYQRAEDWEMNHRIRQAGGLVWFEPRLRVTYRPRGSVRALAVQYFNYGRWRRVVSREHPARSTCATWRHPRRCWPWRGPGGGPRRAGRGARPACGAERRAGAGG